MVLSQSPANPQQSSDASDESEESNTPSPCNTTPRSSKGSPTLGSLCEIDFHRKLDVFDEMIAETLNSSLNTCNQRIFTEQHVVSMLRIPSMDREYFTMIDALQALAELFDTKFVIVEVSRILDDVKRSIVQRIHVITPSSIRTMKNSMNWKPRLELKVGQFVFTTDSMGVEGLKEEYKGRTECFSWIPFKKCQVFLDRSCLQQLFGRLGFYEPSCLMYMLDFPTEFPPDQYRIGACLVLQCSSSSTKHYGIEDIKKVEDMYRFICQAGGYKVQRSDSCGRYQVHAQTNAQDRVIVKDTLAELAHHVHLRKVKLEIAQFNDGVSAIVDAEYILNNEEELKALSTVLEDEVTTNFSEETLNTIAMDRSGNAVAEHPAKIALVRYLAAVYGRGWEHVLPRRLTQETRQQMQSAIEVIENDGMPCCTIRLEGKLYPMYGNTVNHLFETVWREYDELWVDVVQLKRRTPKPIASESISIPSDELHVMRKRLYIHYGHARNTDLLCARTNRGGNACSGHTEHELFVAVWKKYGLKWQCNVKLQSI